MPAKPHSNKGDHAPARNSVRPAKVARARKLLATPGYPSKKVMQAVAELLARELGSGKRKT